MFKLTPEVLACISQAKERENFPAFQVYRIVQVKALKEERVSFFFEMKERPAEGMSKHSLFLPPA